MPRTPLRVGTGYDVHRLVEGIPLVLGGVTIAHTHGLDGHSDADVLTHALMDALLGAASLGDIGQHFPPHDPHYRSISSIVLLRRVADLLRREGWAVVNCDTTVIAEAPRIGPHVATMRTALAEALAIDITQVGIKATTNETLGFAGRREGIAALAVALLERLPEGS